jgi:hypothetical protein
MSIANVERQITDGWLLNVVQQLMQRQLKSTVLVKSIANKVGEHSGDRARLTFRRTSRVEVHESPRR